MVRYTIDRAKPGLVALYVIRPGNGVGQFLQPGAHTGPPMVISSVKFFVKYARGTKGSMLFSPKVKSYKLGTVSG